MTKTYNPLEHSVVQACVGTWKQYECDDFVEALFDFVLNEIRLAHWNVYQHAWDATWHGDAIEDPGIDGIAFTRYYDGCPCEDEDEHRPDCRHLRPNFQHEDVQISWYKYPGRGMSTNQAWTSDEWRAWFDRCVATIRAFAQIGETRQEELRIGLRVRHPNVFPPHDRWLLQVNRTQP